MRYSDPLGLYKVVDDLTRTAIGVSDVRPFCTNTMVACTKGLGAAISYKCVGCGSDWHVTDLTLYIRGQIYAYSGNYNALSSRPSVDKSVVNFAAAVNHEHQWHIDIAKAVVGKLLTDFEGRTFESEDRCNDYGIWTNWEVAAQLHYVYDETQRIENQGGDPRRTPF